MTARRRTHPRIPPSAAPLSPQDDATSPPPPEMSLDPLPVSLGEIMDLSGGVFDDEPSLPGFEMADDPLPSPTLRSYTDATNERAGTQDIYGAALPEKGNPMEKKDAGPSSSAPVLDGEIIAASKPGGTPRYESRIRILDAWQYSGAVATAPAYVDRNWIGYAGEYDRIRQIEPGPCLRVPLTSDPDERTVTICRVGDYVVHEEIVGDDGALSERIEVWEKGQFQKLFLPRAMGLNADARL